MKIAFLLACTICGYTFAQPPEEKARDLAYCQALAAKYRTYVESQDARRPAPNADAEIAIDRCNVGDARDISYAGARALESQDRTAAAQVSVDNC